MARDVQRGGGEERNAGRARQLDERARAVAEVLPDELAELDLPEEADALAVLPLGVREAARKGEGPDGGLREPALGRGGGACYTGQGGAGRGGGREAGGGGRRERAPSEREGGARELVRGEPREEIGLVLLGVRGHHLDSRARTRRAASAAGRGDTTRGVGERRWRWGGAEEAGRRRGARCGARRASRGSGPERSIEA